MLQLAGPRQNSSFCHEFVLWFLLMGTMSSFHRRAISVNISPHRACPVCEEAGPSGSILAMDVLISFVLHYLQPWTADSFITLLGFEGVFSGASSTTLT